MASTAFFMVANRKDRKMAGIFNSSYKYQTRFSEDKKTGEMQIPNNSVITICRAWLVVNTYIWVLILIGCYKHTFDSLATAAFAHIAVIIVVTKQMQFCIKIYKNDLGVSGVFWLPCIFYTFRFHNYKSNCTCWWRTTARLTTVGNFNYKIGTMFKHVHTIISSLCTAAVRFSLHHLNISGINNLRVTE